MVTPAQVRALGAELATLSDPVVQGFIDDAVLELSSDVLQGRYDLAVKYLAAHKAKLYLTPGGTVQTIKVGEVSRTFAVQQSLTTLGRTSYGAEFERIIESTAAARIAVSD